MKNKIAHKYNMQLSNIAQKAWPILLGTKKMGGEFDFWIDYKIPALRDEASFEKF